MVFGSANHDEHHFPEPERFDLHRHSESAHMGFGWGTHCSTAPSSPAWRNASCWRASRRAGRPCGLLPASSSIGSRRSCSAVWRGLRSSGPSGRVGQVSHQQARDAAPAEVIWELHNYRSRGSLYETGWTKYDQRAATDCYRQRDARWHCFLPAHLCDRSTRGGWVSRQGDA